MNCIFCETDKDIRMYSVTCKLDEHRDIYDPDSMQIIDCCSSCFNKNYKLIIIKRKTLSPTYDKQLGATTYEFKENSSHLWIRL